MSDATKVLARRDPDGPYSPENCYWREARSETEARYGIEDIPGLNEPAEIELTRKERRERERMPEREQRMFDIWKRMMWRAAHVRDGRK